MTAYALIRSQIKRINKQNASEIKDFLSKFADRVEKVGRDGVMGLMKSTGSPINMDKIKNLKN